LFKGRIDRGSSAGGSRRRTLLPNLEEKAWRAFMNCAICRDLEQAVEAHLREFEEACRAEAYRICTELAARKNVDMEQARGDLQDHQSVCVYAAKQPIPQPTHTTSTSFRPMAA